MAMSYTRGLEEIDAAARGAFDSRPLSEWQDRVPLVESVGRTAGLDVGSPESTPAFDTSAMDGYAVRSDATSAASRQNPVRFRVQGTIAAGDDPDLVAAHLSAPEAEPQACVEIMTGAQFPTTGAGKLLDACVRVEDVTAVTTAQGETHITLTKPVPASANRRFAGGDIRQGEVILRAGQVVRSSHIMPLASVGIQSVVVAGKPRVGIYSTGQELLRSGKSTSRDVNGPFLVAACLEQGALPTFLGLLDDDSAAMSHALREACKSSNFDVLITSGGVSAGKFDFVRQALEEIGGNIIFHGLAIRPGHPILFGSIPCGNRQTVFFGLPGNPGAAAACFRFLVVRYLRGILGQSIEKPILAILSSPEAEKEKAPNTQDRDQFILGVLQVAQGENIVADVNKHMGPAGLLPFVSANCWIHYRQGQTANFEECVDCYLISPTASADL